MTTASADEITLMARYGITRCQYIATIIVTGDTRP